MVLPKEICVCWSSLSLHKSDPDGLFPPSLVKANPFLCVTRMRKKQSNSSSFFPLRMVEDLDIKVMVFHQFGKGFPKSEKISPDAFIQLALQLAYYR